MPLGMLSFLRFASYSFSGVYGGAPAPGSRYDQANYVLNGEIIGVIRYDIRSNGTWRLEVANYQVAGWEQWSTFDCSTGSKGFVNQLAELPARLPAPPVNDPPYPPNPLGDATPPATSSVPMTPTGDVHADSLVTPLPGTTDEYLDRVNITNAGAVRTGVDALFNATSYSIQDYLTVPSDATCSTAEQAQHCFLPDLAPGASETLVLHTKRRAGVSVETPILMTVGNLGRRTIQDFPGDASYPIFGYVENLYAVATPAPILVAPVPVTPECNPTDSDPQPVTAGVNTRLTTFCKAAAGLGMSVTASHGTATIDSYGSIRYTGDPAWRGTDTVSVTSNNGVGVNSAATTFTVNVVATATAADDSYTVSQNQVLTPTSSLMANDTIPMQAGWMVQAGATPTQHGTVSLNALDGTFTYTPNPDFVGTDSFLYRLSGPAGANSNVAKVTIVVQAH